MKKAGNWSTDCSIGDRKFYSYGFKRHIKLLTIIFFFLAVAFIFGTVEPSRLFGIAAILFLTLFVASFFKERVRSRIEEKDYRGVLIQFYLVFLLIFAVFVSLNLVFALFGIADLIQKAQILVVTRYMVFFVIMGAALVIVPYLARVFRVELHHKYTLGLRDLLKFTLISLILALFIGSSMILLEWLGIISWR